MYGHSQQLVDEAALFDKFFSMEPAVTLDLGWASLPTTAAFVFCVMQRGGSELKPIHQELQAHGSQYNSGTIDFVLTMYEGSDPRRHLWTRDENEGFYVPLPAIEAAPS